MLEIFNFWPTWSDVHTYDPFDLDGCADFKPITVQIREAAAELGRQNTTGASKTIKNKVMRSLFALLELARIAGRRKVIQIQIKLFKLVSVNCFSFQSR